ncbi:MAG: DUF423 domain-containing protein [Kofleriaceae bacterium]|nr:DUF423 domain-containing protein [Kofleriaceae bacterium]
MSVRSPLIALGALNGALAVAAGAFGAHGLREKLEPRALEIFETAARYQMYHALAMILCGVITTRSATTAGWVIQAGIVVFSGSLYALSLSGVKALGAITPLGGLAFIVGWALLAWGAWRG